LKNKQTFRDIQIAGSSGGVSIGNVNQMFQAEPSGEADEEVERSVRILFLAANPPETSRLQLDREVKAIDQALQFSGKSERFKLEQSWAVGDREVQDCLLRYEPDIVHMSGHGTSSGRLILDSGSPLREVQPAQPRTPRTIGDNSTSPLARLFAVVRGRIRCVVLNACYSESLARAIAEHVACVVGMSEAIEDEAAIRFSWSFYNALAYGQSVRAAFDLAAVHVALGGPERDRILRLVGSKCDPAGVTFDHH
jgi:CHAT domain-containing protein